jgi:hypothetical protein
MNPSVAQAVDRYLDQAKYPGKRLGLIERTILQLRLTVRLPRWYSQLLSDYPLAGMYLNYPIYGDSSDDYQSIRLAGLKDIYRETELCYPGLAIRKLGYACLAIDPTGGGDPYFMKVSVGDNPPVYQVFHDVSRIGEEIEKKGTRKIAASLAEFFSNAKVSDYHNPYE